MTETLPTIPSDAPPGTAVGVNLRTAARDAQVRRILGLPPSHVVTDRHVQRAQSTLRRQVIKAKAGMDCQTMVDHFRWRSLQGQAKHAPTPAPTPTPAPVSPPGPTPVSA